MTEILTIETVAELFGCDKKTVSERLLSGDLPGIKFGRSWRIPAAALFKRVNDLALEEAAERRRSAQPPAPATDSGPKRGRKRFTLPG